MNNERPKGKNYQSTVYICMTLSKKNTKRKFEAKNY